MTKKLFIAVICSCFLFLAAGANAATVSWTDWIVTGHNAVIRNVTVGTTDVEVAFTGSYYGALTDGGTNYWNPSTPYISTEVENAPPASDIIQLNYGGEKTITFSQTVVNPLIALVSWNGNVVDFGVPIEIVSYARGYWGSVSGTPVLNTAGTGFYGSGEVHGVIRLLGSYESISFTDTTEYWHGITVGVSGLPAVPVPGALILLGVGLTGLAGISRRRA